MKLLFLSVAPWAPTGYGIVTRNLVPRIINEGHEVTIATKHFHTGAVDWNGIPVISGMDISVLNRMIDNGEADYIITLLDNHALPGIPKKWISYTPFDTQKIPKSISDTLVNPLMIIALTRHGQREIERVGYECLYAPHGVDTKVFCPDKVKRQEGRKNLGWEDNFIIGTVGVNYADDRKNFVNLMMAFKRFHEKHDEARLFLSSNPYDTENNFSLPLAIKNLGLDQLVKWPLPDLAATGQVTDGHMANRYRQMDLFCMPTRGEGFGMPLIEAQACGVPVVTTGASTGPELCATQYLIPVQDHEWEWFNKAWRPNVNSQSIYEALERAYNDPQRVLVAEVGRMTTVAEYDWDEVFATYWKPILKEIEGLKMKVRRTPDYKKLYESFDGRIMMGDCKKWCGRECIEKFPLLPGERLTDRPIISRSYPVLPDDRGKLFIDTECPLHNWISKKFKEEVKNAWDCLWGFPIVRGYFILRNYCFPYAFDGGERFIPMDKLKIDFNSEYKWAMQSQYKTNVPDFSKYLKGKVLEVGCGDGKRVLELRDKGIDAYGFDINPAHVSEIVQKGNAEAMDYPDNSFDVVYSVDVWEHLCEPLLAISEAFRVSSDVVIASITPVEDTCFWQDPTHKVEWDRQRWMREIDQFGEIIDVLEPFTVIARRRS